MNAYTFHITCFDLALLGTIFTGLGLALQLWFTKKINRAGNRFLALALIAVVLWTIWLLGADIGLTGYFSRRRWLHPRFIAQGGDFGAVVSTRIALNHLNRLIGLHLNYIPFNYRPHLPDGEKLTREEIAAQQKTGQFFQAEGAYG